MLEQAACCDATSPMSMPSTSRTGCPIAARRLYPSCIHAGYPHTSAPCFNCGCADLWLPVLLRVRRHRRYANRSSPCPTIALRNDSSSTVCASSCSIRNCAETFARRSLTTHTQRTRMCPAGGAASETRAAGSTTCWRAFTPPSSSSNVASRSRRCYGSTASSRPRRSSSFAPRCSRAPTARRAAAVRTTISS